MILLYICFTISLLCAIVTTIGFLTTLFLIPIIYSLLLFVVWIVSIFCLIENTKDLNKELKRN